MIPAGEADGELFLQDSAGEDDSGLILRGDLEDEGFLSRMTGGDGVIETGCFSVSGAGVDDIIMDSETMTDGNMVTVADDDGRGSDDIILCVGETSDSFCVRVLFP